MIENHAQEALAHCLFRAGAIHPFLREPIEQTPRIPDATVTGIATDGARIYYRPDHKPEASAVAHLLIHCLFRHLPPPENAVGPLWNLACDISAEYLRTELFPGKDAMSTRIRVQDALPEGVDPRLGGAVYRYLMELFEDELEPLHAHFARDDHRYWTTPHPAAMILETPVEPRLNTQQNTPHVCSGNAGSYQEQLEATLARHWPSADALPGGVNRTGRYGLNPGSREERMLLHAAGKYDFTRYLRRFSTTREELRLDLDSFDYIPYCYGLERYGNMPLIEPLEYAESHRVEELVIAIDTSGSCTRPIVERFLGEIERILMRHDYFFARMCVHIIQCDAMIQSHTVIRSCDEWAAYNKDLVIRGRGGTNFTPVFDLVEKLQGRGELRHLKGLLYFTDGDGVYPRKPTPYETAFVFTTRKALSFQLPEWIIPLCLESVEDTGGGRLPPCQWIPRGSDSF